LVPLDPVAPVLEAPEVVLPEALAEVEPVLEAPEVEALEVLAPVEPVLEVLEAVDPTVPVLEALEAVEPLVPELVLPPVLLAPLLAPELVAPELPEPELLPPEPDAVAFTPLVPPVPEEEALVALPLEVLPRVVAEPVEDPEEWVPPLEPLGWWTSAGGGPLQEVDAAPSASTSAARRKSRLTRE
jgi:hypothetical protein